MSSVLPKAGRDPGMIWHELLAEAHDVGRARLLRSLSSKGGGRCETYGKADKQASTDY
jgi:hypothetical protein